MARFIVTDIQATHVEALPQDGGVSVTWDEDERDSMGFHRVAIIGPTAEAVAEYVREHWGDEDGEWFASYVVGRIERIEQHALTVADLDATLADERHLGWGYASAGHFGDSKRARLDRAVVAVANELGLDYEGLFMWSNSKLARWCADEMHGRSPSREAVRHYLNPTVIRDLVVAEGLD